MSVGPIVTVPAQIEVADRLVGTVTVRMAGWLALAALGATAAGVDWPVPAVSGPGLLVLVGGLTGARAVPGGRHVEAWLLPVVGFLRRSRRPRPGEVSNTWTSGKPVARRRMGLRPPSRGWTRRRQRTRTASPRLPVIALATVLTGFVTLDVAVFTVDALRAPARHAAPSDDPGPSMTAANPANSTAPGPFLLFLPGTPAP